MKTRNRKTGYSSNTAKEYIDNKQAIYYLSTELEAQLKFEDNQPTGEIIAYKVWFSQKGLPPFQVKFESEIDLPSYMAMVEFDTLEACEFEQYLLQSLNMGLGALMQGETSYTNSFDTKILSDGFLFIPRLPAGYIIDNDLYQKIFLIANASLYPRYTLLKQNSAYFIALDTDDIHVQRGLFFPWKKGVSERMVISDLEVFASKQDKYILPIMKNLSLNYNKVTSLAIAGNSGSGKSYTLTYFLSLLKNFSELIIVDPKFDTPSRWARENGITVMHPQKNRSKSNFVSEINENLSSCLGLIQQRQEILYENPEHLFDHLTIVIDEVLALS